MTALLPTDDLPVAVWSGSFRLFGIDVKCHRLSDGTNIIEADSMAAILRAMEDGVTEIGDIEAFDAFRRGQIP